MLRAYEDSIHKLLEGDGYRFASSGASGNHDLSQNGGQSSHPEIKRPNIALLNAISDDPRLQESYSQLVGDGWELRRKNIYLKNSSVDGENKIIFIDDDDEPIETQVAWSSDTVRQAYQEDKDYRLKTIREKAIGIFNTAGLTDLEKMAEVYEWAAWFWLYPYPRGDAGELLDDMMLVFTELEPDCIRNNSGTYCIFKGNVVPGVESTGYKYEYRDRSNQVRHTTASLQASYVYGTAGIISLQSREDIKSADTRLNTKCNEIAANLKIFGDLSNIGFIFRQDLGDPAQTDPWTGPEDGVPDP